MRLGGIEAGGTKVVCGVGEIIGDEVRILDRAVFPTERSEITIPRLVSYFKDKNVEALGIASFGPVDLRKDSPTYGYVRLTPKEGWENTDFLSPFVKEFSIPVVFDTDVNGAVLGEALHGGARHCSSAIYITVGTGIGVGIFVNGGVVHGLLHPEAGHLRVERHPLERYRGCCRFHCDEKGNSVCMEGLACGPAISERWGRSGKELSGNQDVWEMEAYYLASGISDLILTLSPEKIIIGGGVMHQPSLLPLIRKKVQENLGGYIQNEALDKSIDEYIISPELGDNAGLIGAFELAKQSREH